MNPPPFIYCNGKQSNRPPNAWRSCCCCENINTYRPEQVLDRLRRRGKAVSKATVYNALRLFAARGIVQQVIVDSERVFYDSNTSAHFHFYNVDQGALIDLDADALHIPELPALPYGTVQEAVDVIVRIRDK